MGQVFPVLMDWDVKDPQKDNPLRFLRTHEFPVKARSHYFSTRCPAAHGRLSVVKI